MQTPYMEGLFHNLTMKFQKSNQHMTKQLSFFISLSAKHTLLLFFLYVVSFFLSHVCSEKRFIIRCRFFLFERSKYGKNEENKKICIECTKLVFQWVHYSFKLFSVSQLRSKKQSPNYVAISNLILKRMFNYFVGFYYLKYISLKRPSNREHQPARKGENHSRSVSS